MSFENERYVSNRVDRIEHLEKHIQRIEKENLELREFANEINQQNIMKGYPMAKEWMDIVNKAKKWEITNER